MLLVAACLGSLFALGAGEQAQDEQHQPKEPEKFQRAVLIRFEGEINPLLEQNLYRKLATAERYKPDLLVIELDSPGGWVDSSLKLAERLRQVDWARTVAFIPREAISGGAVMALGCDDIVIAPHAHLGDAGEIFMDENGVFRYVEEKTRSYLASKLRGLAKAKGRSPSLAEAMCDMDLVVYQVRHRTKGTDAYMSDQELKSEADPEQWETIKPVFGTGKKRFLTMDGSEAVDVGFAQALVSSRRELKDHYGLHHDFIVLEQTSVDTAVMILNAPLITGLIIVIGLVALYVEFSLPGTFVGGMVAALCFALFFWSRFLGGTAGWLELILFVAGLAFLGMELFVIPGFGVAGFSGILLLLVSVIMASQTFFIPHSGRELNTMLTQIGIVGASAVVFLIMAGVISRYLGAIPLARALMLDLPPTAAPASTAPSKSVPEESRFLDHDRFLARYAPAPSKNVPEEARSVSPAPEVHVGDRGIADSMLRPAGKVQFGDRYVDVVSDGTFIDRGRTVRVVEISGNRVVVREVTA
jgi:membrane-bound serine protease (ClpP class)